MDGQERQRRSMRFLDAMFTEAARAYEAGQYGRVCEMMVQMCRERDVPVHWIARGIMVAAVAQARRGFPLEAVKFAKEGVRLFTLLHELDPYNFEALEELGMAGQTLKNSTILAERTLCFNEEDHNGSDLHPRPRYYNLFGDTTDMNGMVLDRSRMGPGQRPRKEGQESVGARSLRLSLAAMRHALSPPGVRLSQLSCRPREPAISARPINVQASEHLQVVPEAPQSQQESESPLSSQSPSSSEPGSPQSSPW
ncbi:MAG: hypothetical protein M1819_004697 [Sarea resinae]|nr:MAG: hypothetical protein M1819_004697 [Sarea resinae]